MLKYETCYIIGKGPSLDALTIEDFGPGPIIAINESITKIESLNLKNPIYSLQQDGKPQCMRRPQRATLLLSQVSKHWFQDYTPRIIYDRTKLNMSDKAFSAIIAMDFAKQWGCKTLIFKAFDACTCDNASYASDIHYYDPRNSLHVFKLHCEIIKLSNHGLKIFFDDQEIKIGPYTIITPTGDRSELMKLCRKYVLHQTLLPSQWIIIDDGKIPMDRTIYQGAEYIRRQPKVTDPDHTLCINMLAALPHVTQPYVLIFEDDDWYHPKYAEYLLEHCDDADLFGINYTYYYHYGIRKYARFSHPGRSSWCTTGFSKKVIPNIMQACHAERRYFLDLRVWNLNLNKKDSKPDKVLHVGLKGLKGRIGQSSGHNVNASYYILDNHNWLEDILGKDIKLYRGLVNKSSTDVPPNNPQYEFPDNFNIRYSHDGSFFIPRQNHQIEKFLDRQFARVPNTLRWFPKITNAISLKSLRSIFKDQTCYIVGKGKSLDMLHAEHFKDGPIIAINEAIHKVEAFGLSNPIFMMQQDVRLKKSCWPKYGSVLVPTSIAHLFHTHNSLYTFILMELGLTSTPPTVIAAIEVAKLLGVSMIKFICFDAYTEQQTAYADCIGYTAEKFGQPVRFLQQTAVINKHIRGIKTEFITPKVPVQPSACIP